MTAVYAPAINDSAGDARPGVCHQISASITFALAKMRAAILLIAFLSAEVSAFGTVHHCEPRDAINHDNTANCDTMLRCLHGYWSAGDVTGAAMYQLSGIDHMPQFRSCMQDH